MSPHPLSKSSLSTSGGMIAVWSPVVTLETAGAEGTERPTGREGTPFVGGVEVGRSIGVGFAPLLFGCMSPLAVLSLLVKDEMAHPSIWFPTPG